MIVGIILSAGESSRMGTPKQLLPWGEKNILQQVLDNTSTSRLEKILLILGYRAEHIIDRINLSSRTHIVINNEYKKGMSSSVKCGIKNAPNDTEAFMLVLGDQPFINAAIIDKLIDCYHSGKHGIVIPVYDGKRGHPVIFDILYKDELLSISDQGAKEVINRHLDDILEVPVDSSNILVDIDTPQEYEKARIRFDSSNRTEV